MCLSCTSRHISSSRELCAAASAKSKLRLNVTVGKQARLGMQQGRGGRRRDELADVAVVVDVAGGVTVPLGVTVLLRECCVAKRRAISARHSRVCVVERQQALVTPDAAALGVRVSQDPPPWWRPESRWFWRSRYVGGSACERVVRC